MAKQNAPQRRSERRDNAPPPALGPGRGVRVEESIVVRRTAPELYRLWRDLETMGRVFRHVERVECGARSRSHWVVKGPVGTTLEWDAEIINEVENELIGWQSLPGSDVACAGSVAFQPAGDSQGTRVTVTLQYDPPAGPIGAAIAGLFGQDPRQKIAEDLQRFKQTMESQAASSR